MQKAPQTVINRTLSDMRTRAPSWIAGEVAQIYALNKQEVNKRGNMTVKGASVESLEIKYRGKPLSPAVFKMTPKTPKTSYTLKAEILRGKQEVLGKVRKLTKKQKKALIKNLTREGTQKSDHSPIMLMRMPNNDTYVPFQRRSYNRKDIHKITTLSVPQMVRNDKVAPNITAVINENLGKRLDHHMKLLKK